MSVQHSPRALRNERRISDEVLRQIEHDLDLAEARLMGGVLE